MVAEMIKLRKELDRLEIKWWDDSQNNYRPMDRTKFEINGHQWSVINGYGSYGGYDSLEPLNKGLLELMTTCVNDGEPVGYLTAKEIIEMIGNQ